MRLWSLHPRYLDRVGLVALWREALLAQAVLRGETRGYCFHPQLVRFRHHPDPEGAIAVYLEGVYCEASRRGYQFDAGKIDCNRTKQAIPVTRGQIRYERGHLLKKLFLRNALACERLLTVNEPESHPLFVVVEGEIEQWERIAKNKPRRMLFIPHHEPGKRHRKKKKSSSQTILNNQL
jgi:hypothetical protein